MHTITSRQHPEIKKICTLHTAKGRAIEQLFIAEGSRTCTTLLKSTIPLAHIYFTGQELSNGRLAIQEAHRTVIESQKLSEKQITIVSPAVMEKISTVTQPSGILALFKIPSSTTKDVQPGLVLAQIADPGNMGTLIRSSAAMNIQTVIIVEGVDPWSPKVVQASAGTIGFVDIITLSWQQLLTKKKNFTLTALVIDSPHTIEAVSLQNTLLVVGSEAHGIPNNWIQDCEQTATIAMPGKTESLNAAVAGSIALYMMSKK